MHTVHSRDLLEQWHRLVRICGPIVASREDAEDCASAALLTVLEVPPADVGNLEAFLVTVAKRRAFDSVRGHDRGRRRTARLAGVHDLDVVDVAEDVVERAEARWLSETARLSLSPQAYDVLRLMAEGHTIDEAARLVGVTKRAAESHLLRARRTLKASWGKTFAAVGVAFACVRRPWLAAPATALAAGVLLIPQPAAGPVPPSSESRPFAVNVVLPVAAGHAALAEPAGGTAVTAGSRPTPRQTAAYASPSAAPRATAVEGPLGTRTEIFDKDSGTTEATAAEEVLACAAAFRVSTTYIGC